MFKLAKIALVAGILTTLTACTGHVQNTKNNCSYDTCCTRRSLSPRSSAAAARQQISKLFSGIKKPGMSRFFYW